jgi:hypothetical protein
MRILSFLLEINYSVYHMYWMVGSQWYLNVNILWKQPTIYALFIKVTHSSLAYVI